MILFFLFYYNVTVTRPQGHGVAFLNLDRAFLYSLAYFSLKVCPGISEWHAQQDIIDYMGILSVEFPHEGLG